MKETINTMLGDPEADFTPILEEKHEHSKHASFESETQPTTTTTATVATEQGLLAPPQESPSWDSNRWTFFSLSLPYLPPFTFSTPN